MSCLTASDTEKKIETMPNSNGIKDKNLSTHPLLEDYHPDPIIVPRAEVLRKEPDEDQRMAAPLVRCGVLKDNPSVVVYMRVQEGSTAGVNDTVQFVLAEPTKEEIKFDEHLAFDEKWTGEVGRWRGCADTIDQQLDAWKRYLGKVIGRNDPRKESSPAEVGESSAENTDIDEEGGGEDDDEDSWDIEDYEKPFHYFLATGRVPSDIEKWEKRILDEANFDDGEDSFDDLNDIDEEEDEDVAEDRRNAARVRAHFAHIYPDLKTKRDAWNAFDMDTADPPFDTEDEDILTRISQYYVAVVPVVRGLPEPPISMLRQALQEVRARAAPQVTQTKTYMTWEGSRVLGSAPENVYHWGSYEETIGKVERMTPLKRCLGFDIPDIPDIEETPEYEEYKEVIRRVMRQINGPKPSKGYT